MVYARRTFSHSCLRKGNREYAFILGLCGLPGIAAEDFLRGSLLTCFSLIGWSLMPILCLVAHLVAVLRWRQEHDALTSGQPNARYELLPEAGARHERTL